MKRRVAAGTYQMPKSSGKWRSSNQIKCDASSSHSFLPSLSPCVCLRKLASIFHNSFITIIYLFMLYATAQNAFGDVISQPCLLHIRTYASHAKKRILFIRFYYLQDFDFWSKSVEGVEHFLTGIFFLSLLVTIFTVWSHLRHRHRAYAEW